MPTLHKCLAKITKEIQELKKDMKNELMALKEELNTNFRQRFANFKEDINKKLQANSDELQDQTTNMEAKEALLTALHEQRKLREKLTDLEGRSLRNNVRIYGVPEGTEGESVPCFVEELLQRQLEGTSLLMFSNLTPKR